MLVVLICRSSFSITNTLVTLISSKHAMSRATTVANIMVIMPWVTRSIFLSNTILPQSCGCGCHATLASWITPSALVDIIRDHFWHYIFSLAYLWTVFHTVCLLNKEHISMILGCFNDLWSGTSVVNIHAEALIRLRWLWPVMVVRPHIVRSTTNLMIITVLLLSRWSPVSSSKTSKPWGIHLFLKKVTWIGIMNIWIILKSLHQVLRVVSSIMVVELGDSAIRLALWWIILRINTAMGAILWKLSLTVL